jgi:dsRNA-specific ribonuclease
MAEPPLNESRVNQAWIGDAVLALYARLKILREDGRVDGEKCKRLTSNQFLGTLGEPTKVEADVGRVYLREGLEAAFQWIEQRLLPLFDRQEANRARRNPQRSKGRG